MGSKKPSGAAGRRRRKELDEFERQRDLQRVDTDLVQPFVDLGAPPDDVLSGLTYATKHLLLTLHQVATDRVLPTERRWKMVADFSAKLGLLHSRALTEERVEQLTEQRKPPSKLQKLAGV